MKPGIRSLYLHHLIIFIIIIGCTALITTAQENRVSSAEITSKELLQHVRYLSSDELAGRKTGEEGNRLAAQYIANEFASYGLTPMGDHGSWFQNFPFLASVRPGKINRLTFSQTGWVLTCEMNDGFRPLSISGDTSVSAPVVFAGYGIAADSLHYNDYQGMDVRGAIVIVLRYSPKGATNDSIFAKYTPFMVKAFTAREKGAAGIIFVNGPLYGEEPILAGFTVGENANAGIGVMTMQWTLLDSLFRRQGKDLRSIQRRLNTELKPASFLLTGVNGDFQTQIEKVYGTTANIVGYIEGSDPTMKSEALVIGAHMDHLGMGGAGSGSLQPDTVAIHHGADDNASGTAGLLELAQYLSQHRDQLKRSVLFTSFSGEELGLFGSEYYVKHPAIPLERTIAMINMDMIGRLKDSVLVVEGMGTSPGWEQLVRQENTDSLRLKFKPDGYGPSDHSSFYGQNIPVIFFFTNLHENYHRPSDTWDKINYGGEEHVVKLVNRVALAISDAKDKPAFTKVSGVSSGTTGGDRQGIRVSLGVIPDYAEDVAGMKISGTRPGSAAEKAGLKGGDILVSFGGKTIKNIYDFTYLLGEYKPGDVVTLIVKRGSEEVSLKATLEARK